MAPGKLSWIHTVVIAASYCSDSPNRPRRCPVDVTASSFTGASASTSAARSNRRPGVKAWSINWPPTSCEGIPACGDIRANLFRMRQFYETYRGDEKVSALLRQLPWTHNLVILGKSKRAEEREYYLRMATSEKWSSRELERQINGAYCRRASRHDASPVGKSRQVWCSATETG